MSFLPKTMFLTVTIAAMFLVLARATLGDETCVCYVGQEIDKTAGKRYGWSQPEQTLCECTEFRLGGVNMKPQVQPYEMMVGGDNQIKHGMVSPTPAPDLRVSTAAPVTAQLPCSIIYITESHWSQVEEPLDLPMRLEFSVQGPGNAWVSFSPGTMGLKHAKFGVGLYSSSLAIWKLEDDLTWTHVQTNSDLNISGETMFVTYNSGHIEVGVRDVETSYMTYDLPSPPQAEWLFITIWSKEGTQWSFFKPCTHFTLITQTG